jgi:hypothetical protein
MTAPGLTNLRVLQVELGARFGRARIGQAGPLFENFLTEGPLLEGRHLQLQQLGLIFLPAQCALTAHLLELVATLGEVRQGLGVEREGIGLGRDLAQGLEMAGAALFEIQDVLPLIDLGQELSLADAVAVPHSHLDQFAPDLGADFHRSRRPDGAVGEDRPDEFTAHDLTDVDADGLFFLFRLGLLTACIGIGRRGNGRRAVGSIALGPIFPAATGESERQDQKPRHRAQPAAAGGTPDRRAVLNEFRLAR